MFRELLQRIDLKKLAALPRTGSREHLVDTAFIGLLSVALYAVFPPFSDIHRLWRREAGLAIVGGLGPGEFEYPPVAALYFEPLIGLPSSRWAVVINGIVMVVAAVGVTSLLLKAAEGENVAMDAVDVRIWSMSPALLAFLPINWDVGAAYLAVLAVSTLYSRQVNVSGTLLAVGTSLKVFPGALVLPLVPLVRDWAKRFRFVGSGVVVLGASYVGYIMVRPETWRVHLEFAGSRADFESTIWGVFDWLGGMADAGLSVASVNLLSALSVGVALVALTVWVWITRPTLAQAATLALIALLLFNKVFKPQYALWVLPFLAWTGAKRASVRTFELTAIVHIAVTYFALPSALVPLAAAVRVGTLGVLAMEILGRARPHRRSHE